MGGIPSACVKNGRELPYCVRNVAVDLMETVTEETRRYCSACDCEVDYGKDTNCPSGEYLNSA